MVMSLCPHFLAHPVDILHHRAVLLMIISDNRLAQRSRQQVPGDVACIQ